MAWAHFPQCPAFHFNPWEQPLVDWVIVKPTDALVKELIFFFQILEEPTFDDQALGLQAITQFLLGVPRTLRRKIWANGKVSEFKRRIAELRTNLSAMTNLVLASYGRWPHDARVTRFAKLVENTLSTLMYAILAEPFDDGLGFMQKICDSLIQAFRQLIFLEIPVVVSDGESDDED